MKIILRSVLCLCTAFLLCPSKAKAQTEKPSGSDTLPPPYATKSVKNYSDVIGWKDGKTPIAPVGFTVTRYADGFDNPRWLYVLANGDVLVAETNSATNIAKKVGGAIIGASKADNLSKSANRITLLHKDANSGQVTKQTFLDGLNQPFGMLVLGKYFYVANTNALWRYPYKPGQTKITAQGQKIIDLPAGKHNRHYARNIITNEDGTKILIAVGSGSNVAEDGLENEINRADILEINSDGSGMKIYASGLRNPCAMDWAPITHKLWTAVNERDELGDELVPDYLTSVTPGGFYGWPYCYWGQHMDPRVKQTSAQVKNTIVPDIDLGSHTASLGFIFYKKDAFPEKYHNGAFVTQHGSWNRSVLTGYKVVFIPFSNGKPSGKMEDFLTGFIDNIDKKTVYGRPVGIVVMPDGSLLLADDTSNTIWQIAANK